MELVEKHEEMLKSLKHDTSMLCLGGRAELLQQMWSRREQLYILRRKQVTECEAARRRNDRLLQDVQKIENDLRGKRLPHPNLLALETRYLVSVEESVPVWEHFLLGVGPHPTDEPEQTKRTNKQNPSTARGQGLPPRPQARSRRRPV